MCSILLEQASALVLCSITFPVLRAMMLAHASDCRLAQPSLYNTRSGQARLCKCVADAGCGHTSLRAVRKQRSSGCSRRQKTVVLASSVPQDVIDVEGTLVDDRIPVTVSIMSMFLRARLFYMRYLSGISLDSSAACRSSLASWAPGRQLC